MKMGDFQHEVIEFLVYGGLFHYLIVFIDEYLYEDDEDA